MSDDIRWPLSPPEQKRGPFDVHDVPTLRACSRAPHKPEDCKGSPDESCRWVVVK